VDLPPGAPVWYVRAGVASGDGTRGAPFATISEAIAASAASDVVAVAPGVYEEEVLVDRPVSIVGACNEVVVTHRSGTGSVYVRDADGALLRNLTLVDGSVALWAVRSRVSLDAIVVARFSSAGVYVADSTVDARDVVLVDAGRDHVLAASNSDLTVERLVIDGGSGDAIRTFSSTLALDDVYVAPRLHLFVSWASTSAVLRRAEIFSRGEISMYLAGPALELEDAIVRRPPGAVDAPSVVFLSDGMAARLDRVRIERTRGTGLAVATPDTTVIASDLVIHDVAADATGAHALEIGSGAHITLDRAHIARAAGLGVLVDAAGSALDARDLAVIDIEPDPSGYFGRALQIQRDGAATVERLLVQSANEAAVVAAFNGRVTAVDADVEGTEPRGCVPARCAPAGIGVGAYVGGAVDLEWFRIASNALVGAQVASNGSLDLARGEVVDNVVGVNVQVEGYDLDRLRDDVAYRDNGTNLDTTSLPVPAPTVETGAP
jgi:hypothetical protein